MLRNFLSVLKYTAQGLASVLVIILFLPLVICMIILNGIATLYTKLLKFLRRDPRRSLKLPELTDKKWQDADTPGEFVESFKRFSTKVAKIAHAKPGKLVYEGFDALADPPEEADGKELCLKQTLTSPYAKVQLVFNFGLWLREGASEVGAMVFDDLALFPASEAIALKSQVHHRLEPLFISTEGDVWVIIALLRGYDVRFTQSGQLWAFSPEHNAWLVRYGSSSDYGLRAKFTGGTARQSWFDKKSNT